jgi:hypothetical protein
MRLRGTVIGALNLFHAGPGDGNTSTGPRVMADLKILRLLDRP